ncbi:hypothetical protein HYH03_010526 [Edaphochlamys debaryana]|uniref:Rubisco LSMT substrate-binding domain-containing protein n=1 Tax=Edaphochlamys debaryana TaxID=47281 RepID=A0A836BVV9_9CHLO|nr:hypothetical protein HYH03_010526 [Edaphochlamys debaryana]|eukprot:KAG2491081.1 hypothetical protein HYH03_010526 [Edaphochlamys debaryana]
MLGRSCGVGARSAEVRTHSGPPSATVARALASSAPRHAHQVFLGDVACCCSTGPSSSQLAAPVRWAPRRSCVVPAAVGPAATSPAPAAGGCSAAPSSSSAAGGTVDAAAARLKAWVLQHSKALPTKLTPVHLPDGSYGLVADEPIPRGAALVRVPRALLMSADTARASPAVGALVAAPGAGSGPGLGEWPALVLHLLAERAAGKGSFWAPYLATLPQDMSHHPLLWGPERLGWLQGSPLLGALAERREQVASDTAALVAAGANELPIAQAWREATGSDLVTEASVGWAAAVLLSRGFSLDLAEEEPAEGDLSYWGTWAPHGPDTLALVPWADLLPHCAQAGPEACAHFCFELGGVTLAAHRAYAPGEAVAGSHGPLLSPADLFLDYALAEEGGLGLGVEGPGAEGAVGSSGSSGRRQEEEGEGEEEGEWGAGHRYDLDPKEVAPPRGPRNAALLRALAAVQGEGARIALGEAGPDAASLAYLRAALASDAELVRAGWRVKASDADVQAACRAVGALAQPASAASERALLEALAGAIARAQAAFPTALEQDLQRLAGGGGAERVEGPERLALVAVASQKAALAGSARAVATWRARLAAGCPVADLYESDDSYDDDEAYDSPGGYDGDADTWGSGEEQAARGAGRGARDSDAGWGGSAAGSGGVATGNGRRRR